MGSPQTVEVPEVWRTREDQNPLQVNQFFGKVVIAAKFSARVISL